MSKKLASALLAAVLAVSALGASFSYELDLLGFDPLHKPYLADKYRPSLSLGYAYYTSARGGGAAGCLPTSTRTGGTTATGPARWRRRGRKTTAPGSSI